MKILNWKEYKDKNKEGKYYIYLNDKSIPMNHLQTGTFIECENKEEAIKIYNKWKDDKYQNTKILGGSI